MMARRIHNVQLHVAVDNTGALGKDGDAPLLLKVVAVHGTLIVEADACLRQEAVHQCSLSVINVSNNCQVAHVFGLAGLEDFLHLLHVHFLDGEKALGGQSKNAGWCAERHQALVALHSLETAGGVAGQNFGRASINGLKHGMRFTGL
jgi:hypothetical protein